MNWSAKAQGSTGKGDVTLWSDTKGLFGSAAVSVADIKYDADQTAAYYGQQNVAARDVVIDDKVSNSQADALKQTLASAASGAPPETSTSAAPMSGGTTTGSSAYSAGTARGAGASNGVTSGAYEGNAK